MVKATITLPILLASVSAAIGAVLNGRIAPSVFVIVGKDGEGNLTPVYGAENLLVMELSAAEHTPWLNGYGGVAPKVLTVERSGSRFRVFDGPDNVAEVNDLRYKSFTAFGDFVSALASGDINTLGSTSAVILDQTGSGSLKLYPIADEDFIDLDENGTLLLDVERPKSEQRAFFEY